MAEETRWLTIDQVAERYAISKATIRRLYRDGAITAYDRGAVKGPYFFDREELDERLTLRPVRQDQEGGE